MYGLHAIFLWLCSAVLAASALEFEIAVRDTAGDLAKWATLQIDPASPSSYVYTPEAGDAPEITEGCVGVLEPAGFACQTLFRRDSARQSLSAVLSGDGGLLQVRFVEGPRTKCFLQVPDQVPRPVLKPPTTGGGRAQQKKSQPAAPTEPDADEPEKSFFEKYWIYALPIGLVLISNMMSPGGAAAAES